MSQSNLQLLLHAGELEYICKTIRESSNTNTFVGGCLFGLWRNSLKQPVIQFVTGPGKDFKDERSVRKLFKSRYVESYARILKEKHCLLHLGFWFYGPQHEAEAKQIILEQSAYNVLLLINYEQETLQGGEYFLKKSGMKESSPLFKEDVLPDHSSFRKFKALTTEIANEGDVVSPERFEGQVGQRLTKNLPSRVQVEEAITSEKQWYSTDDGMANLQLLFQYFQGEGITPTMSRDTVTQDMQFGLSDGYCLDFPANFPRKMPTIRARDGSRYDPPQWYSREGDVCTAVVQTVVDYLRNPQRSRGTKYH